ncbi:MAG: hypothetical protein LBQ23_02095 [Puniceicoccales bacterium]|jgi:Tfp pilus assembly major pilin PilA|nr:hypothetical protein [Puniceicoccales bacterium]
MKKLNFLFLVLTVMVLGILSVRIPYVQKYMVKRYLNRHFSEVYVDTVSIGTNTAKIRKLAFSFKDTNFGVADFDVVWSLRDLIFLHELKIKDVSANGVFIGYTRAEAATKKGIKVSIHNQVEYENLKNQFAKLQGIVDFVKSPKFPIKTTIDHIKINGLLSIDESLIADVTLDGGGFSPSGVAVIDVTSDVAIGKTTPTKLNFNGKAKIFQSQNASIDDIDFKCNCELFNPAKEQKKMYDIVSIYKVAPSENLYNLRIDSDHGKEVVCNVEIKHQKDQQKLFIECENFFNTKGLDPSIFPPITFNTRWSGEFEFQNWSGLLKGNGGCIFGKKFAKIYCPSLKSSLSISGGMVLKMTNGTLAINSMEAVCNSEDKSWNIALSSTNPIVVWDKNAGYLAPKNIFDSGTNLCRLTIEKFNPKIFSTAKSTWRVDTAISGQIDISSADGRWMIKSSKGSLLQFGDLTVAKNSKKYIEKANISCQVDLNLGKTIQLALNDIAINGTSGDEIVAGNVNFSFADGKQLNALDCYMVCQLNRLAQISWLAAETPIKSGICSGYVNFTQKLDSTTVQGDLNLKSFALDDHSIPINSKLTMDFTHDNDDIKSNMTLNVVGQHETSVFLTANTTHESNTPAESTLKFDLKGDALSIPDLINIVKVPASMFSANNDLLSAKAKYRTNVVGQNDISIQQEPKSSQLEWIEKLIKGNGECLVSIKKLFLPKEVVLDDVECLCYMLKDKIDLRTFNFLLAESPFSSNATLEYFKDKTQNPYNFAFSSTFYMKDIGKICKKVNPSKEAIMEGSGKINVQLSAEGPDVLTTITSGQGTINVGCSNGVLHLANYLDLKNRAILGAFELTTSILSQMNNTAANANAIIEEFQQLHYDTIQIHINRNKNLDIFMDSLNIIGPTVHIRAYGSIPHTKRHFYNSPLSVDVKIDAAGKFGEAFARLGLVTSKPKNSKYMEGPKFNIKGTLANPDFSDFMKILYPLF